MGKVPKKKKAAVLSEKQIDHLLSVAEGSDDGGDGGGGNFEDVASQQIATAYDFKHPARVNKDQLRTLENLHDNFARLLSSTLSGALGAVVDVNTAFVDQTTYAEFIMSLSNPSCSYQFTLGPTKGQVVMDIALPVAFGCVDRICGGTGSGQGMGPRQLTAIEMGLINQIVRRVIDDLESTWAPFLKVEISDVELETNPEFMQITAASEIVILLAFEVKLPKASGLISLCYPFFTLESILPLLGQQTRVRPPADREALRLQNRLRLGSASLDLRAELGRTRLPLGALRRLQVGEVVELETRRDEPALVWVGDRPKYLAWPFATENGQLKLKLAGEVPVSQEVRYTDKA